MATSSRSETEPTTLQMLQAMCRTARPALFAIPPGKRSIWSIILWWELRRIPYNLIVGLVSLASYALYLYVMYLPGIRDPDQEATEPFSLFLIAFLANICYTFGWIAELVVRRVRRGESGAVGPRLFFVGLFFSLFVVAAPWLGISALEWIIHALK